MCFRIFSLSLEIGELDRLTACMCVCTWERVFSLKFDAGIHSHRKSCSPILEINLMGGKMRDLFHYVTNSFKQSDK